MELVNVWLNAAAIVAIAVAAWIAFRHRETVTALRSSAEAWQLEHQALKETAARLGAENDRLTAENVALLARTDLSILLERHEDLEASLAGIFARLTREQSRTNEVLERIDMTLVRCFPDNGGEA